jgi:DNA-binding response OmpR family regulator
VLRTADVNDAPDSPRPHPPRVLVAEDDAPMRALVAQILRKDGFDVEEIADGQGLLLRLMETSLPRHAAIDLIVSDIRMPFCTGLDVLKKVHLSRHGTPVLLMTAFGEPDLARRVADMGGRLLDKPFPPHALRREVKELLAGRRR